MPTQPEKKFVHLRDQPGLKLETLKRQAVLGIQQVEKDINTLKEKLKIAEDFLNTQPNLSPPVRQNLESTMQKSTTDLSLYQTRLTKMKHRLMAILKKSNIA